MKKAILYVLLPIGAALSGCAPDLGDFKYIAQQPNVTATVLTTEIKPASSEYGSPTLEISGVAQENSPFPVKHYYLTLKYEASFGGEKKFDSVVMIEMTDGKGAFDGSLYMSDLPKGAEKYPVVLKLKDAAWSPETKASVDLVVHDK